MPNTQWLTCQCGHVGHWHRGRCRVHHCGCDAFRRATALTHTPTSAPSPFTSSARSRGRRFNDHPTRDMGTSG